MGQDRRSKPCRADHRKVRGSGACPTPTRHSWALGIIASIQNQWRGVELDRRARCCPWRPGRDNLPRSSRSTG